jgi:hypothetical protein
VRRSIFGLCCCFVNNTDSNSIKRVPFRRRKRRRHEVQPFMVPDENIASPNLILNVGVLNT